MAWRHAGQLKFASYLTGMQSNQLSRALLLILVGSTATVLGCASVPVPAGVPTFSIQEFVRAPEKYDGQVVRVCAERLRKESQLPEWNLSTSAVVGYHPAEISVVPCAGERLMRSSQNCVVGTVAKRDGPGRVIVKDPGSANPWYLRAQCAAPA